MANQLPTDGAVILAWGRGEALPVEIVGESPRRTGTTLYYLPTRVAISGPTTFTADLLRSTVVDADAMFFGRSNDNMNFGKGSARSPTARSPWRDCSTPDRLTIALDFGGEPGVDGDLIEVRPLTRSRSPATDDGQGGLRGTRRRWAARRRSCST